ncbi:MAG TPA: biotin--[acetyl-CoA-carboxylase] ligase [Thermoanaerobaculia bacterium]|nr:biotin--[acetyl-CoA-carboxylase] ligase [Thermoanaerobaculia bacterium]
MSRPPATSLRLLQFADGTLDPGRWTTFENVACLSSIPSSNALARELVDFYFQEEQFLPATLLAAEEQPRARGRSGRDWKAPRGRGLYFTCLLRMEREVPLSIVPIAVARWLREAIAQSCGIEPRVKWPNDVYLGRRKLAGILSEACTQGEDSYLAVGVGINVLGTPAQVGVPDATTVEAETGRRFGLAPLLQAVVDYLDQGFAQPDWAREIERWERVAAHRRGDRIRVRADGRVIAGEYLGLDPSGFLRLATATGETVVSSGEVAEW